MDLDNIDVYELLQQGRDLNDFEDYLFALHERYGGLLGPAKLAMSVKRTPGYRKTSKFISAQQQMSTALSYSAKIQEAFNAMFDVLSGEDIAYVLGALKRRYGPDMVESYLPNVILHIAELDVRDRHNIALKYYNVLEHYFKRQ